MTVVRLTAVDKRFGGIPSLRGIDLDLRAGEIHALVGENGAGKSTLGKIIGGYHSRDGGEMEVFGRRIEGAWGPRRALDAGIAMIQQELAMVPALSVQDNVFLGIENKRLGVLARDNARRYSELDQVAGFGINGEARLSTLRVADRQKVEIMRALARDAKVIIMDEPTASLTAGDIDRLHTTMKRLRDNGRTIVYVTHFLDDVLAVADRITVLRDGSKIVTTDAAGQTKASLVAAMIGSSVDVSYPPLPARPVDAKPILRVESLKTSSGVKGVSFDIRPGELVGLIGLVGSGRTEIARAIAGVDPISSGTVTFDGNVIGGQSQREIIKKGLVLVPEERRRQGLVMTGSSRHNMSLPHLASYSKLGVLKGGAELSRVETLMESLNVVPRKPDQKVVTLSGGNQQKVLIGKWLMQRPKLVILDEPTKGVDVGARRMIYDVITELASHGTAILIISSEIEEVLGLSHRAFLMSDGRFVEEVASAGADPDDILRTLFDATGKHEVN